MTTTAALRFALAAAAFCAVGTAAATADAKPRRVVILDFDGPRALADTSRSTVASMLGEQYDVVATKRWEEARASAKETRGPAGWRKAARQSGVDAVIEGWVQDEGRHKLLYVLVRDASNGDEVDKVSIRLGRAGVSDASTAKLRTALDEVLEYVEGTPELGSKLPVVSGKQASEMLGAKRRLDGDARAATADDDDRDEADEPAPRRRARRDRDDRDDRDDRADRAERADRDDRDDRRDRDDADEDGGVTERKPARASLEVAAKDQETNEALSIFGPTSVEAEIYTGKSPVHVPKATPRFAIYGGGYYGARSFVPDAESLDAQDYSARSKGLQLGAQIYPFPSKKLDGTMSGLGFSFNLYHSAASVVGADTDDTVGNYGINQFGYEGAVHYRQPLGLVSIDGEAGYSSHTYALSGDFPLDVPDTQYAAFHAGAHLDLHVTSAATVGFGAKLLYVLGQGDAADVDSWYGPGSSSGFNLDASFVVPLPKDLFVRGELAYRRISTSLDGAGALTEEYNAFGYVDATMNGSVNVGVHF